MVMYMGLFKNETAVKRSDISLSSTMADIS